MTTCRKRLFTLAVVVGFILPIFWGILEFFFFNARDSAITKIFFIAAYTTCPVWFIGGFWGDIGSPVLNGALYGVVLWLACKLRLAGHADKS